jgi:hypothetical protein
MAEPAGSGPVSQTATSEFIPLVFDLSLEPLIPSKETGPTTPTRQEIHKNVNGYLRLQNGDRGRALRLCISPGYGAVITDEIYNHCRDMTDEELNPICEANANLDVVRQLLRKPVRPRGERHYEDPVIRDIGEFPLISRYRRQRPLQLSECGSTQSWRLAWKSGAGRSTCGSVLLLGMIELTPGLNTLMREVITSNKLSL